MSQIHFHTRNTTVNVSSRERAYTNVMCNRILSASLGINEWVNEDSPIMKIIPKDSLRFKHDDVPLYQSLNSWLISPFLDDNYFILPDKTEVPIFDVQLNTMLVMGSDPIKLLARIHAQCEIHCYIKPKNKEWVASIIEQGLETSIYMEELGWERLIKLLKEDKTETVVLSYSVTDSFPDPRYAEDFIPWSAETEIEHEEFLESWYDLDFSEQWERSFKGLEKDPFLEIKPDNWNEYRFGSGHSGFSLLKIAASLDE